MIENYVPILKCKAGEQKALLNLQDDFKDKIKPLFEIPLPSASQKKKKKPISDLIDSFWFGHSFYFYFMSAWYNDEPEALSDFLEQEAPALIIDGLGTPVIDLSSIEYINDWKTLSSNGVAIRIRNNEFEKINDMLNPLFASNTISRNHTDLILDLQYISPNDLFIKSTVLKSVCAEITNIHEYHSIIIASSSFPKAVQSWERHQVYSSERLENKLHTLAKQISSEHNFHYIFSDYGTTDIEEITFVPGMSVNFKIKYTTPTSYLYIKSYSTKMGGLDIRNVRNCIQLLIDSGEFAGATYSWADNMLYNIAEGISNSPGNSTTWVSYSTNHHISLIENTI